MHHHGEWLALLMFSSPALKCAARDQGIGWDYGVQFGGLHLVTNALGILIPPGAPGNLGSRICRWRRGDPVTDCPRQWPQAEALSSPAFIVAGGCATSWLEVTEASSPRRLEVSHGKLLLSGGCDT